MRESGAVRLLVQTPTRCTSLERSAPADQILQEKLICSTGDRHPPMFEECGRRYGEQVSRECQDLHRRPRSKYSHAAVRALPRMSRALALAGVHGRRGSTVRPGGPAGVTRPFDSSSEAVSCPDVGPSSDSRMMPFLEPVRGHVAGRRPELYPPPVAGSDRAGPAAVDEPPSRYSGGITTARNLEVGDGVRGAEVAKHVIDHQEAGLKDLLSILVIVKRPAVPHL